MNTRAARFVGLGLLLAALPVTIAFALVPSRSRSAAIDTIVIHTIGGPVCRARRIYFSTVERSAEYWLRNWFPVQAKVSIHYVVDRTGGVAGDSSSEWLVAEHAGPEWNQRSIGIELVNSGDGIDPFPDAQIAALVNLIREIRARHPQIKIEGIVGHSQLDQRMLTDEDKSFPHTVSDPDCGLKMKVDPGPRFPWSKVITQVSNPFASVTPNPPSAVTVM